MIVTMTPMSKFRVKPINNSENLSSSIEYSVLYGWLGDHEDVFVVRGNNGRTDNLRNHEVTVIL